MTAPTPPQPAAPTLASLREGYHALVVGATGAIGQAWVQSLRADPRCARVSEASRSGPAALDWTDEASIERFAQSMISQAPLHLVVDATGALNIDGAGPEKRLEDLRAAQLQRAMTVNAIGPALLLRHLWPLLASGERTIWAKLSARVGSIEDNRKGGWYAYRASKAALNQLLQTAAVELARRRPELVIAALQPGTVRSGLSRPFVGEQAMEPDESVRRLMGVIDALAVTGRAHFVDHQGQAIVW